MMLPTVHVGAVGGRPRPPGRITPGSINLEGIGLTALSRRQLENVRDNRVAMIFQEPVIAVGVISLRSLRFVRGTVLEARDETYIQAFRSVGASTRRIIVRHVMPNVLAPLVVQISSSAGLAMIAEASLSLLGLGVQPPDASWGSMLGDAFRYITRSPTLIVIPGVAIAATVLAFNVVGDGLRDSFGREIRRDE